MDSVTVSTKYQIVIPKPVRERMRIKPGEKFQFITLDDQIRLVRVRPIAHARGFLKGYGLTFTREEDDRV